MTIVWARSANFGGASAIWHAVDSAVPGLETRCRKIQLSAQRVWFRLEPPPLKRCKTCVHAVREVGK